MSLTKKVQELGASPEAIQHHYNTGNEFYRLWLGKTMAYTCANWDETDENDSLDVAQKRNIDFHIKNAHAVGAKRVLDVGCGWGGTLQRLVKVHGVEQAVGLNLSQSQLEWVAQLNEPKIKGILEGWADHVPEEPYDAIISIGSFEAFAKLGLSSPEKVHVYRTFFEKCHQWLKPGGWVSLQTIAYGNSVAEDASPFITSEIFQESDLPRLVELTEAVDCLFEVMSLRNDSHHYPRTLKQWYSQLRENRESAIELVGEKQVVRFERYLRLVRHMFYKGRCVLYRIAFRRIDNPRVWQKNK